MESTTLYISASTAQKDIVFVRDNVTPPANLLINDTSYPHDLIDIPPPGIVYTLFGLTCFLAILGVCGNVLVHMVMQRVGDTSKVHDLLITILAAFDIIAIVTTALNQRSVHYIFRT